MSLAQPLPDHALLTRYRDARAYTDCFAIDVPGRVSQADYIHAFYTSPLFKLERLVLALLVAKPSTDVQARRLADGDITQFAAWSQQARNEDQILMLDFMKKTCSWLMVTPVADGGTRLWFGTAVVAAHIADDGRASLGAGFDQLMGFHKLYSVALLRAAARGLRRK